MTAIDPIHNSQDFHKVTIITGGSKGIGEGCARVFCAAGAKVVICARGREAGEALAAELSAQGPGECHFEACDVSAPEQIRELIEKTVERHGRLDCLINNAGQHPPHQPLDAFSIEDFREVLDINLVSVFAGCKYALPYLRQTRGSIINMSSLVGAMGQQTATTYCATKGGINGLTKALAIEEAANGVRVNALLPGNILSDSRKQGVARARNPEELDNLADSWQWEGRSGTIEEAGYACLFLASDGARFITGIELVLSGGAELGYGIKAPGKLGLDINLLSPGL